MSGYSAWKTFERRFAKLMRGERLWRPDYSDSIPDGENETHTWDTKAYQRHAAVSLFVKNEKKYRKYTGKRRFVLALFAREHRGQGDFVLLRAKDYAEDQAELRVLQDYRNARPACGTCGGKDGPHPECPDPACGR